MPTRLMDSNEWQDGSHSTMTPGEGNNLMGPMLNFHLLSKLSQVTSFVIIGDRSREENWPFSISESWHFIQVKLESAGQWSPEGVRSRHLLLPVGVNRRLEDNLQRQVGHDIKPHFSKPSGAKTWAAAVTSLFWGIVHWSVVKQLKDCSSTR